MSDTADIRIQGPPPPKRHAIGRGSWRAHRAQRDRVRDLRASLVALCNTLLEETEPYQELNAQVAAAWDALPRWQRWSLITDPTLWRGVTPRRPGKDRAR